MVDPAHAGSAELSYSEAAHVSAHLRTPSSIRTAPQSALTEAS